MGAMYEKGQTKRYSRVASFSGGGKSKKPMSDEDVEATEESEANPFGKGTTRVLNKTNGAKRMRSGGACRMYDGGKVRGGGCEISGRTRGRFV